MRSSQKKMKILAIANASTCVGHRKYLRWAMKVLALKTVSTCVEKQKKIDTTKKYQHQAKIV